MNSAGGCIRGPFSRARPVKNEEEHCPGPISSSFSRWFTLTRGLSRVRDGLHACAGIPLQSVTSPTIRYDSRGRNGEKGEMGGWGMGYRTNLKVKRRRGSPTAVGLDERRYDEENGDENERRGELFTLTQVHEGTGNLVTISPPFCPMRPYWLTH